MSSSASASYALKANPGLYALQAVGHVLAPHVQDTVSFSPQLGLITAGANGDGNVRVWPVPALENMDTAALATLLPLTLGPFQQPVTVLEPVQDTVAVGSGSRVYVWANQSAGQTTTWGPRQTLDSHTGFVTSLAYDWVGKTRTSN